MTNFGYLFRTPSAVLLTALVLSLPAQLNAGDLRPFSSDGCSLFPDGTPGDRGKWCLCCLSHDMAYWQGGTADERRKADERLRDCVLDLTGDKQLAETMYLGVRAGGHPAFLTWYRWGYGWSYGRGYRALSDAEKQRVLERLDEYWHQHPTGYCTERGPKSVATVTDAEGSGMGIAPQGLRKEGVQRRIERWENSRTPGR